MSVGLWVEVYRLNDGNKNKACNSHPTYYDIVKITAARPLVLDCVMRQLVRFESFQDFFRSP